MSDLADQLQLQPHRQASLACSDCPVRGLSLCATLSDADLQKFEKVRRLRRARPAEQLAREDDEGTLLATVRTGVVAMTASTVNGTDQIVGLAFAGEFIGRPFGERTTFGVTPMGHAELCVFPGAAFDTMARENRELGHQLLIRTLDDLEKTRKWMTMLTTTSARQKVANFLLAMRRRPSVVLPGRDGLYLRLPFSRSQVGEMLGLNIETVSRQFTWLKREGLVALPNRRDVAVLDLARLRCESGQS